MVNALTNKPDGESGPEGYCSAALKNAFPSFVPCSYGSVTGADGASFEFEGTTYTVEHMAYDVAQDDYILRFYVSPASLFHSELQDWQLQIGSNSFSFSDADRATSTAAGCSMARYSWDLEDDDSERPWPEPDTGSTVAVKLVEGSNDATLSALTLKDASDGSAFAFTPSFTSDTEAYTATVRHGLEYVEVSATAAESEATVEYLNASGNAYYDRNSRTEALDTRLLIGSNTYLVKVTAPDDVTTKTYTLVVTRRDRLKGRFSGLPDSHDGSTPFTVNLVFREEIDSPLANVAAAVAVDNGTMSDFSARGGSGRKYRMTVTPSSAGALRIRLRAARDCSESHSICSASGNQFVRGISRWVSTGNDARLQALWLTRYGNWIRRTPAFDPETTAYVAEVSDNVGRLRLHARPYTSGVSIAVAGPDGTFTASDRWDGGKTVELEPPEGAATWTVTVTSADGNSTKTYRVTLNRAGPVEPSDSAQCLGQVISPNVPEYFTKLGSLTVTPAGGSLVEGPGSGPFPFYQRKHTAYVTNSTTAVSVQATGEHANSTATVLTGSRDEPLAEPASFRNILWVAIKVRTDVGEKCYQSWHGLKVVKLPPGRTSRGTVVGPLVADIFDEPSSHDGTSAFTVRLALSRDVDITPEAMRDYALIVSGATVTAASRVDGRSDLWKLTVEPSGTGPVSLLVPIARACTEIGALCTADGQTVELGDGVTIAGPTQERSLPPLSAEFESAPTEHDGASAFTLELAFSEAVFDGNESVDKNQVIRDAVAVTGGTLRWGRRTVQGAYDRWTLTIEPSGYDDVTVTLPATSGACSEAGAICTPGGTPLTGTATATIEGPSLPALSVADDEAQEGPDAYLRFEITLSEASDDPVTFDIATSDGTAIAGTDYVAKSRSKTIAAGTTTDWFRVYVIDDSHNEGDETFTVTISNIMGATIADGTAVGTIENSDAMPQAWLARFGRTVADQVLDAVESRMSAPRTGGTELTLGGQRIGDAAAADEEPETADAEAGLETLADWLQGGNDDDALGFESRAVTERELLTGSSFSLAGGSAESGFGALWGRAAVSSFDGREDDLTLDGEVTSAMLGADWAMGRGSAGLILSHSRGEGGFRSEAGDGAVESTLTGVYPWGRYAVSEEPRALGRCGLRHGHADADAGGDGADRDRHGSQDGRRRRAQRADGGAGGGRTGARGHVGRDGRTDVIGRGAGRAGQPCGLGRRGDTAQAGSRGDVAACAGRRGGPDAERRDRAVPGRGRRGDRFGGRHRRRPCVERPGAGHRGGGACARPAHPRRGGLPRARLRGLPRLGSRPCIGAWPEPHDPPDGGGGCFGRHGRASELGDRTPFSPTRARTATICSSAVWRRGSAMGSPCSAGAGRAYRSSVWVSRMRAGSTSTPGVWWRRATTGWCSGSTWRGRCASA